MNAKPWSKYILCVCGLHLTIANRILSYIWYFDNRSIILLFRTKGFKWWSLFRNKLSNFCRIANLFWDAFFDNRLCNKLLWCAYCWTFYFNFILMYTNHSDDNNFIVPLIEVTFLRSKLEITIFSRSIYLINVGNQIENRNIV